MSRRRKGRFSISIISIGISIAILSCASILRSSTQKIQINSAPPGAKVRIDGQVFTTPTYVELKRNRNYYITIEKEGYIPQQIYIKGKISWEWVALDFFLWGITGVVVDFVTGKIYDLEPRFINVTMIKRKTTEQIGKMETEKHGKEDRYSPKVVIFSPEDNLQVMSSRVVVRGVVVDDVGVREVRVNGRKVERSRGVEVVPKTRFEVRDSFAFEVEVELVPGENWIEVEAEDISGKRVVRRVVVKRVAGVSGVPAPATPTYHLPRIWALIVGINDYKDDRIPDLRYAERDAIGIFKFLRTPQGGSVTLKRIKLLLGSDATRANILAGLKEILLRRADRDDLVLIYFVGHGVVGELREETFLLPYDARLDIVEGTGISQSEIMRYVRRSRAKRVVLIVDACHSGGIGGVGALFASRNLPELTTKLLKSIARAREGVGILTASSSYEKSLESEKWGGGHGVFTYYLLIGLKGRADSNADGVITLRELYEYVYEKVKEATGGKQHPDYEGNLDIPIAVVK